MTTEELIIAVVRVLGSLPVLRWPLAGGILAVLVDLSDLFMRNLIEAGGVGNYQEFDKWLDQVYMLTFLLVALRWAPVPRGIAVVLYAYRLIGFVTFEITGTREVLLIFPNLFEVWFLFVAGVHFFKIDFDYSPKHVAMAFVPLLSIKMFQEYTLHYGQWLEGFTAVEAVEAIWDWLTSPFR
ncbi:MAG: hypothetical protein IH957_06830 [Chloroflexi bacterium]|nr:hypothetical protein [Chloroflexota bacterium]